MDINSELRSLVTEQDAALSGFADLHGIYPGEMQYGISVAVRMTPEIVRSIHEGPNIEYYNEYLRLNEKLNLIVTAAEKFLHANGYKAHAQTTDTVREYGYYRTLLPHKTVATVSGLGWIGKSALLVTEQYGPAVRISSLVTDAELECGTPVTESKCGSCMVCTEACPAGAISGKLWQRELDRNEFYDAYKCRMKAQQLSTERFNVTITMCGKCIEVCPYTQKYINGH